MPRAQVVRADTLDLQDTSTPSAQDHSRQPSHPAPFGEGPPAPHQAVSLRSAGLDSVELHSRSPRASQDLSGKELQLLHEHSEGEDADDSLVDGDVSAHGGDGNPTGPGAVAGGAGGHHAGVRGDGSGDDESDEGMDEDLMDKISSSPSIDDGGYTHLPTSLHRALPTLSSRHSVHRVSKVDEIEAMEAAASHSSLSDQTPEHSNFSLSKASVVSPMRRRSRDSRKESVGSVPGSFVDSEDDGAVDYEEDTMELLNVDEENLATQEEGDVEVGHDEMSQFSPRSPRRSLFYEDLDDHASRDSFSEPTSSRGSTRQSKAVRRTSDMDDRPPAHNYYTCAHYDSDGSDTSAPRTPSWDGNVEGPVWVEGRRVEAVEVMDDNCDEEVAAIAIALSRDVSFNATRFVDVGWGSECLRETEDIDFEFVYALHTFVATVEGQANATKGDTMVLLDDSNSYWWLVRVVKDGSIGYLPAEHIETPLERLARLNKHRNIDLASTMLGDNPEKTRNPLVQAMRRRNAKKVNFAGPTYFEAAEKEYSSDEENEEDLGFMTISAEAAMQEEEAHEDPQTSTQRPRPDADASEPIDAQSRSQDHVNGIDPRPDVVNGSNSLDASARMHDEGVGNAGDLTEASDDNLPKSNRKMRNTDSFYKDDSIETRKINLTPSLLRDDQAAAAAQQASQAAERPRQSLESDKGTAVVEKPEKSKEEKKKEKKSNVLSGLFKRKDRKSKQQIDDDDPDWLKKEIAAERGSPQPKPTTEATAPISNGDRGLSPSSPHSPGRTLPQRQSSKLQKAPPKNQSLRRSPSRDESTGTKPLHVSTQPSQAPQLEGPSASSPLTVPFEDSNSPLGQDGTSETVGAPSARNPSPLASGSATTPAGPSAVDAAGLAQAGDANGGPGRARGVFSPIKDALHMPSAASGDVKPEKVKKARSRMALEDSDSSADESAGQPAVGAEGPKPPARAAPTAPPLSEEGASSNRAASPFHEQLGGSPVQVSPLIAAEQAPALVGDSSSQDDAAVSPPSPASTPELIERPSDHVRSSDSTTTTTPTPSTPAPTTPHRTHPTPALVSSSVTSSPSQHTTTSSSQRTNGGSAPPWSDASLRSYLESDNNDIRDLLVVVHDTSGCKPPGPNHPVVGSFGKETERLGGMQSRLDGMLQDLLSRRMGAAGGGRMKR